MIIVRLTVTIVLVTLAMFSATFLWTNVFERPWTRDAHIRGSVVGVAPQVEGPIVEVAVANNATVEAGDVLFKIDETNYTLALKSAQANVAAAQASADDAEQQAKRFDTLLKRGSPSVAQVDVDDVNLKAQAARAALQQAQAALDRAKVDLTRTTVRAPVAGRVTNLTADVGDYAAVGTAVLAIVDSDSFRVDAYFLETKLPRIKVGDPARIRLMASGEVMSGHVQGIAAGIAFTQDRSALLLQAPDPSFEWVRLAQRVPVQIALEGTPRSVPFFNGATVTVIVQPTGESTPLWQRLLQALEDGFGWLG